MRLRQQVCGLGGSATCCAYRLMVIHCLSIPPPPPLPPPLPVHLYTILYPTARDTPNMRSLAQQHSRFPFRLLTHSSCQRGPAQSCSSSSSSSSSSAFSSAFSSASSSASSSSSCTLYIRRAGHMHTYKHQMYIEWDIYIHTYIHRERDMRIRVGIGCI